MNLLMESAVPAEVGQYTNEFFWCREFVLVLLVVLVWVIEGDDEGLEDLVARELGFVDLIFLMSLSL